jgi:hypothetical protein
MAESKYEKYIKRNIQPNEMPLRVTQKQAITMHKNLIADIGDFGFHFNFVAILAPHMLADPPHDHNCDEMLFFIPADMDKYPDLGGEVELALGEEWEKHTITTAAILTLPPGVNHGPFYMKRVDRPFYFGHMLMASEYFSSQTKKGEGAPVTG